LNLVDDSRYTFLADSNGVSIPLSIASAGLQILSAIPGDYNRDSKVDGDDYSLWRTTFDNSLSTPGAAADGNHNGRIDVADYVTWRKLRSGASSSNVSGGPPLATSEVPEPSSYMLVGYVILLTAHYRHRMSTCQVSRMKTCHEADSAILRCISK
jgi:hypothetical protein